MRLGPDDPPPELVAALQEIDEDADLVHLGGDEWLLGVRRPNPAASDRLQEQLAQLDPVKAASGEAAKEFRLLQFCAKGFRPIQLYHAERPGPEIVEDFRIRDYNWRIRPAEAVAELKDETLIEARDQRRTERIHEFVDAEGPSLFRHVFKRARSFVQRAVPWSD